VVTVVLTGGLGPELFPVVFRFREGRAGVVTVSVVRETSGVTEGGDSMLTFAATGTWIKWRAKACTRIAAMTRTRKRPAAKTRGGIPLRGPADGVAGWSCAGVSGRQPPQEGQKRQADSGMAVPQEGQKVYAMICMCRVSGGVKKGIRNR
jgi:hypothetical protein